MNFPHFAVGPQRWLSSHMLNNVHVSMFGSGHLIMHLDCFLMMVNYKIGNSKKTNGTVEIEVMLSETLWSKRKICNSLPRRGIVSHDNHDVHRYSAR